MSKHTLGRGLSSLIPSVHDKITSKRKLADPPSTSWKKSLEGIIQVPLSRISKNPLQPRRSFSEEALSELIESIKERGILLPLIVTEETPGNFQLIAGERRLRAASALKLETVPVLVKKVSKGDKLEIALVENIQRQNLNFIDEALAYLRLQEEFKLTQEEIAKKVGKKRSTVANILRLLTLPQEMQDAISQGKLTQGHAKVLLGLLDSKRRKTFFSRLMQESWSVSKTQAQVEKKHTKKTILPDAEIAAWQNDLRNALATKVKITKRGKRGRIMIDFYSLEELKNIISRIIRGL